MLLALKRQVNKALKSDRIARATAAEAEAQRHLERGDIRKAFGAIKGWYKEVGPRPPKPSEEDIAETRAKQAALHAPRETPHDPIPVYIEPYEIDDGAPTEEEVATAVHKFKTGKAAGATGIKTT